MIALDVVAFLERAMDDAIMTNFAGLYYLVMGNVTADAAQTLRNHRRLREWPARDCPTARSTSLKETTSNPLCFKSPAERATQGT